MKKTILAMVILSLNLFANQINKDGCIETQLGQSNTYIVKCDNDKYRVTYNDAFKHDVIEFIELGKVKKEKNNKRTPAMGGEMERTKNKTY